jgi:hypothetical protein
MVKAEQRDKRAVSPYVNYWTIGLIWPTPSCVRISKSSRSLANSTARFRKRNVASILTGAAFASKTRPEDSSFQRERQSQRHSFGWIPDLISGRVVSDLTEPSEAVRRRADGSGHAHRAEPVQ